MKIRLVICVIILTFSINFAVLAKNETMLQKQWDNFIITTELDYSAEEGELNLEIKSDTAYHVIYYRDIYDDFYHSQKPYVAYSIDGKYSYNDNLELRGHVTGSSIFGNEHLSDLDFGGGFKAQLIDQDSIIVAATAYACYGYNETSYSTCLAIDAKFDNNLTLHNYLSLLKFNDSFGEGLIKAGSSGLSYRYDQQNALKAYLYTNFDSMGQTINLMYRHDYSNRVCSLSSFVMSLNSDRFHINNLVEVEPISGLVFSGYYKYNNIWNDDIGIETRIDYTDFTLVIGYKSIIGYESREVSAKSRYCTLFYDLLEDLEMELTLSQYNLDDTYLKFVLTYLI